MDVAVFDGKGRDGLYGLAVDPYFCAAACFNNFTNGASHQV
jgi:hypothetical protein